MLNGAFSENTNQDNNVKMINMSLKKKEKEIIVAKENLVNEHPSTENLIGINNDNNIANHDSSIIINKELNLIENYNTSIKIYYYK